jgi:hypothetical protein
MSAICRFVNWQSLWTTDATGTTLREMIERPSLRWARAD